MKKIIITFFVFLSGISNAQTISNNPILFTAFDSKTAHYQIYLRDKSLRKSVQLTKSISDKSNPQMGNKVSEFYFDSETLVKKCSGRLFYYLEKRPSSASKELLFGCVPLKISSGVIEGYSLTGGDGEITGVKDYLVGKGEELSYTHDGVTHAAEPVLSVHDDKSGTLILHDGEEYLGTGSYQDGFVQYYSPEGTVVQNDGLASDTDDDLPWDGVIVCKGCFNKLGITLIQNDVNNDVDANSNNNHQNQDSNQNSNQETDVSAENQNNSNSNANSANTVTVTNGSTSENNINVNVTVEVNSINTNNVNGSANSNGSAATGGATFTQPIPENTTDAEVTENLSDPTSAGVSSTFPSATYLSGGGGCSLLSTKTQSVNKVSEVGFYLTAFFFFLFRRNKYAKSH